MDYEFTVTLRFGSPNLREADAHRSDLAAILDVIFEDTRVVEVGDLRTGVALQPAP